MTNHKRNKYTSVLLTRDNCVLLGRRIIRDIPGGLWEIPGGRVEVGETPRIAACREAHEELGVIIKPSSLTLYGAMIGPGVRDTRVKWDNYYYRTSNFEGEPRVMEEKSHHFLEWIPIPRLFDMRDVISITSNALSFFLKDC